MEKNPILNSASQKHLGISSPGPSNKTQNCDSNTEKKPKNYNITITPPDMSTNSVLNHSKTERAHKSLHVLSESQKSPQTLYHTHSQPLSFPISAKFFLANCPINLPTREISEIAEHEDIYFLPERQTSDIAEAETCKYDDEDGDYILKIKEHLAFRYEIFLILGKGTYGQVVKCFDHKHQEFVAIKVIKNQKRFHKQAITELKILQKLRSNDPDGIYNVVKIKNYFLFRKHICITFELLSINLYELLTRNNFEGLSLTLIHRFAVQLLVCLQYIKKHNIIHCDLKPENILLKTLDKPLIKVIDFGSSCLNGEIKAFYIQSRFYRAPEVVLGIHYSFEIDMWGLGCILAELFTGYPMFPADSEQHLLALMIKFLGSPPLNLVKKSSKKELFFDSNLEPRRFCDRRGPLIPGSKSLEVFLQGASEPFIDFITKCLVWEPEARLKPLDGLEHPWIVEGLKGKNQ